MPDSGANHDVFGQCYDARAEPLGGEFQVNAYAVGDQSGPAVAVRPTGDFVVVWHSLDASETGLFGQRYRGRAVFSDGFESGDTEAWDQTVP